jgi:hypothetical protein
MILGFISFSLALMVEFGAHIPHDLLMAFEWAHFLIFACAMLYVANALLASVRHSPPSAAAAAEQIPAAGRRRALVIGRNAAAVRTEGLHALTSHADGRERWRRRCAAGGGCRT